MLCTSVPCAQRNGGREGDAAPAQAGAPNQRLPCPPALWLQTLSMAAELRLPQSMSPEAKARYVGQLVALLGLAKCKDTRVGDAKTRGLSGGGWAGAWGLGGTWAGGGLAPSRAESGVAGRCCCPGMHVCQYVHVYRYTCLVQLHSRCACRYVRACFWLDGL